MEPQGPTVDEAGGIDIDRATEHLSRAVNELAMALLTDASLSEASSTERQQFAKYLTIAKIKLENAIAVVRSGGPREAPASREAVDAASAGPGADEPAREVPFPGR
jgi:hypothetical protein